MTWGATVGVAWLLGGLHKTTVFFCFDLVESIQTTGLVQHGRRSRINCSLRLPVPTISDQEAGVVANADYLEG